MIYINVDEIDKVDEILMDKIRNEFNKGFCIRFTDTFLENNIITKEESIKIKDKCEKMEY